MKNDFFKDTRLLESLEYIDSDLIGEVADKLRVPSASESLGRRREKKTPFHAWRHIAALVACALLMSALIPAFSLLLGNVIPSATDGEAANGEISGDGETDSEAPAKEYCTVAITGDPDHVLYSGKIGKRVEKGIGFMLDREDIESGVLREGFEIVSARITMKGETLTDVYDVEKNILMIPKVTGDVEIELETRRIMLDIVLIIDGVQVDVQTLEYGSTYSYVYEFDDGLIVTTMGGGSTGRNMSNHDLDNYNHTITFKIDKVIDSSIMRYDIEYVKDEH